MQSIRRNHILLSYLMIPFGLLIIGVDQLFLESSFQKSLPGDPHSLFIVNLLFGFPHVLAGNIQLLDKEYISFHKVGLIICVLLSFLFPFSVLTYYGMSTFIIVEFLVAAFHAIGQQVGIATLFSSFDKKYFSVWKWSSRVAITIVALRIIAPHLMVSGLNYLLYFSLLGFLLSGLHMLKGCRSKEGIYYIGSNLALVFAFYVFSLLNYPFFSILIMRLPHDITAFLFYMNHSTIRNDGGAKNWIVSLLHVPKKVGGFFLPLLVIPLAYFLEQWEAAFLFNAFMSYFHYTSETFVWKSSGLSLKSIKVV